MSLILLPAVDVVEGRAVRLVQGVAGSETEYGSALDAALGWQRDGAEWIHLVDLDAAFGRKAPKILEIGFGMGETTAKIAAAMPDHDFLGIEVHTPGVGALCKLIAEGNLTNLRIMQHDAVEVMRDMIADGALAGVHLFFPDPWRKKRHFKRRIVQPDFVALVARKLAPGGYFHCATDWEDYAHWMLEILSAEPQLQNTADGFAPRP